MSDYFFDLLFLPGVVLHVSQDTVSLVLFWGGFSTIVQILYIPPFGDDRSINVYHAS